jgi:hypothetical protein
MVVVAWILGSLAVLAGLYGLHRLALYLEKRDLIYYKRKPASGGGYNPLQEFVQPNYRNVVEVGEQRSVEDDEGGPPEAGR